MALPSATACCNSRTVTRTASHNRLRSLGSWISAAVTCCRRARPCHFPASPAGRSPAAPCQNNFALRGKAKFVRVCACGSRGCECRGIQDRTSEFHLSVLQALAATRRLLQQCYTQRTLVVKAKGDIQNDDRFLRCHPLFNWMLGRGELDAAVVLDDPAYILR